MLEMFCASHGWSFEIISDLGSGMNYNKRKNKKLIENLEKVTLDATRNQ